MRGANLFFCGTLNSTWPFYKLGLYKPYSSHITLYCSVIHTWHGDCRSLTGNSFRRCHMQQIRRRIETNRTRKGVNMKVTKLGGMAGMTCLMLMAGSTA